MKNIESLCENLAKLKAEESRIVDERRAIEDEILEAAEIDDNQEGVKTLTDTGNFEVKVTTRINRTVDGDMLQELARENGLFDQLQHLFRWKPSINMRAWKDASEEITAPLASAITSKAGRPSVSIKPLESK